MEKNNDHKFEMKKETAELLEKSAIFLELTTAEKVILSFLVRGFTLDDIAVETHHSREYVEIIENRLRKKLTAKNTDELNIIARLFNMA